jgi:hypothetical protein
MECKYKQNGCCQIASDLACAFVPVPTSEAACKVCVSGDEPMDINSVTVSLAISALHSAGQFDIERHSHLHELSIQKCSGERIVLSEGSECGVGSILSRKLSWFVRKDDSCVICRYRAAKMNEWGPDGCEDKIELILVWLQHSAKKRGVPFFKEAVRLVVQSAIKEERKNLCCKKK